MFISNHQYTYGIFDAILMTIEYRDYSMFVNVPGYPKPESSIFVQHNNMAKRRK